MKFGLLQIFQNHRGAMSDAQMWDEEVRLGLLAEELGFDSVWAVEHHFSDVGRIRLAGEVKCRPACLPATMRMVRSDRSRPHPLVRPR